MAFRGKRDVGDMNRSYQWYNRAFDPELILLERASPLRASDWIYFCVAHLSRVYRLFITKGGGGGRHVVVTRHCRRMNVAPL